MLPSGSSFEAESVQQAGLELFTGPPVRRGRFTVVYEQSSSRVRLTETTPDGTVRWRTMLVPRARGDEIATDIAAGRNGFGHPRHDSL